jgi:hypothetical protein
MPGLDLCKQGRLAGQVAVTSSVANVVAALALALPATLIKAGTQCLTA